ncbi:MAG: hypothetical protein LBL79_14020 [Prevotella sp.]|jgi:hypothetical protein|nr:hypothetical protein [Prevotella sp.]
MANTLAEKGYEVIIIVKNNYFSMMSRDTHNKLNIISYNSVLEAALLASNYNPLVFHCFMQYAKSEECELMLKAGFKRVVFETYDSLKGVRNIRMRIKYFENIIYNTEKYCIENSAGVAMRDFGLVCQKERYGYNPKREIEFLDYCDAAQFKENSASNYDEIINVCYCGGSHEATRPGFVTERHGLVSSLLSKENIHYHMFSAPSVSEIERELLRKYDREIPGFHYHGTVPHDELIAEVFKMDASAFFASEDFSQQTFFTAESIKYTCSNKHFDSLAAGLPLLNSGNVCTVLLNRFKEYGMVYEMPIDRIPELAEDFKKKLPELKANVLKYRHLFAVQHHIDRLIDFYKEVGASND